MPRDRIITSQPLPADEPAGNASRPVGGLRPQRLSELIGQKKVLARMGIGISAAQQRKEPLEHALLSGPPGLGKTTLAHVIAREMDANLKITSGPALQRTGDLMSFLMSLERGDVLFIDEIHRLPAVVEEFLYPAMEDFRVDYTAEQGLGSKTVNFPLERFTLIGATTRKGLLTGPLRDRFGLHFDFDFYTPAELACIVSRSAEVLGCRAEQTAYQRIAERSRGTPRIANRLLLRVRDFSAVRHASRMTAAIVDDALAIEEIDTLGLDPLDRRFLATLMDVYEGGPAGIEALAATMGQERDTLEDTVEPYLLQIGFVRRTPKGREATPAAWKHLNRQPPTKSLTEENGADLF